MIQEQVEKLLKKSAKKTKTLQFSMHVSAVNLDYSFSSAQENQRFHSASVGKLMTSTLIFKAIELGKITIDAPIEDYLEPGLLNDLFVFENQDYQHAVTLRHLLGHTSGINDYFESKTFDGSNFIDTVLHDTDHFWTPQDLLNFTRSHQKAVGGPGDTFLYSDTGFVILGLIIENIFKMPFNKVLETIIFEPMHMKDTCLCFYGEDFEPNALAPLYLNGVDVHRFKSLSCDWSGGGLSTTAQDLVKFMRALYTYELITKASLDQMSNFNHRFHQGLYYGLGMMQVRFEEFFFLLKGLPRLQGHIGVTGVHAWFDPIFKNTFVLNVGNTKDMSLSFRLLISIVQVIQKAR